MPSIGLAFPNAMKELLHLFKLDEKKVNTARPIPFKYLSRSTGPKTLNNRARYWLP